MATLSWTNLKLDPNSPSLIVSETKKKFFGQYLYKIVVYMPATRTVLSKFKTSAKDIIEERIEHLKYINRHWGRSDRTYKAYELAQASAEQIEYYRNVRETHKDKIKFRVEEPFLTIYSDDEQLLYDIASNEPTQRLREVHKPANEKAQAVLNNGEVIIKKSTDYEYKVVFREGVIHDSEMLLQVYNYLDSLGDEVSMTKSCVKNLTLRHRWFTNTYFYAKDPSVLTFLNLIAPGFVSGIFKLTKID